MKCIYILPILLVVGFLYSCTLTGNDDQDLTLEELTVDIDPRIVNKEKPIVSPDFSVSPGLYNSDFGVIVSSIYYDITIHYTIDGSEPTTESPIYTNPILLDGDDQDFIIKAIAAHEDQISSVATAYYKIDYEYDEELIHTENSLEEYQKLMVGKWIGYRKTPWEGETNIEVNIDEDFTYSSEVLDPYYYLGNYGWKDEETGTTWNRDFYVESEEPAFYYGSDESTPNHLIGLNSVRDDDVLGEIQLVWPIVYTTRIFPLEETTFKDGGDVFEFHFKHPEACCSVEVYLIRVDK